jgi:tartrate-resistant acid phosphatase type 5
MPRGRPRLPALACALCALVLVAGCSGRTPSASAPATPEPPLTFAVIGDYGYGSTQESAVASLVASWKPHFVLTAGDNYYNEAGTGGGSKYDLSAAAYYGGWMKDNSTTVGLTSEATGTSNAFFPALGNHDYHDASPAPSTYLDYFTLPGAGFANTSGNERYYDFVEGPIHFFVLNSNEEEPDGIVKDSKQARWLKGALAASASRWNIVLCHHPPYASRGERKRMRWPFAKWGADAVISGHGHFYERVMHSGIPYFVNGLGGAPRQRFAIRPKGSVVRYRNNWGAQRVTVTASGVRLEFFSVTGRRIDSYDLPAKVD